MITCENVRVCENESKGFLDLLCIYHWTLSVSNYLGLTFSMECGTHLTQTTFLVQILPPTYSIRYFLFFHLDMLTKIFYIPIFYLMSYNTPLKKNRFPQFYNIGPTKHTNKNSKLQQKNNNISTNSACI